MQWISEEFIKKNIKYPILIEEIKLAFRDSNIKCPPKLAYNYKSSISKDDNTLLFMPAWDNLKYYGVKLITATPNNKEEKLPYLNGMYILFNAVNGQPIIVMDAKLITNMRTAATSVLASNFLAKKTATSVLILGNGSLCPFYIEAYASKPTVDFIYVWGRDYKKSKEIVSLLNNQGKVKIKAIKEYSNLIKEVDIISCITSVYSPLITSNHLSSGQHFDLAGSYTSKMQEVSTDVVANCSIYTDNYNITLEHSGELVNAIKEGKINRLDIKGDLKFLCNEDRTKRMNSTENTLFKCTGMAIEDLVIASLIYKQSEKINEKNI